MPTSVLGATIGDGSQGGDEVRLRFSLLGELEVESCGRVIDVPGRRLRSLLAYLLSNRNQTISRDRIIDALWGDRPPRSASHALDALVSRLRRSLGPEAASRLETTAGGYRVRVAAEELDIDRFERLVRSGRRALAEGDAERAGERLRRALEEWRGDAFGELMYEPCFAEEAARLEELRLGALEAKFEAKFRSGTCEELVPEIEAFVAANPLREHARAQLMRALYRCGRQSDALDAYRTGYSLLTQQGLEPNGELQHAQMSILQHDPLLARGDHGTGDQPVTRYVSNGGVAIAYQVSGKGPYDIVYAPPFVTNVDLTWQVPRWAELLRRFGSFGRLIRFDKRGTGMSDPVDPGELETSVEDARAVMDAALCTEAAIIGASEAGPIAILLAASHPERVWALVLWGAVARVAWAEDYPLGVPRSELERGVAEDERIWTEPGYAEALARSIGAADVPQLASLWRQSATPGVVRALEQHYFDVDVRDALPLIRVPTLVLNREGDVDATAGAKYLAENIADARHVVLPGADHVMFAAGNFEPIVAEIKTFLDAAWQERGAAALRA
jgi:DNA-binding SARP family transcriptional activator/pimeloyl-ACP methyl ester carboxylesterase